MRKRLALFGSGRGSNGESIYQAIQKGEIRGDIVVIISDIPGSGLLNKAKQWSIPCYLVERNSYESSLAFEVRILKLLQEHEVDAILLAGYMRIVGETLLDAYPYKILNIHPSVLPAFRGLYAQQQALDAGVSYTGCTVHFVDEGVDTGPVIMQAIVHVHTGDTVHSLSERILQEEHRIYPEAVRLFCDDALHIEGGKVLVNKRGKDESLCHR